MKILSKEAFKEIVKKAITRTAFSNLLESCSNQKKTNLLVYTKLQPQDYLTKLYPWQSKLISRCRSKTLDIKTHQTFKYNDTLCRWCNLHEESLSHIINCGEESLDILDLSNTEKMDSGKIAMLSRITYRIREFMEKIDY